MRPPPADASPTPTTPQLRHHDAIISIVLPLTEGDILARIGAIEEALAGTPHECLLVYDAGSPLLAEIEALERPTSLRLVRNEGRTSGAALQTAFRAAAGDVVITLHAAGDDLQLIAGLADGIRVGGCSVMVPRVRRRYALIEWVLWWGAGLHALDLCTGFRACAGNFLDTLTLESLHWQTAGCEITIKAHLAGAEIGEIPAGESSAQTPGSALEGCWRWIAQALRWAIVVWATWGAMLLLATAAAGWLRGVRAGVFVNVLVLAAGAFAFILAVRRVRLRTRLADAFFPLVLLNPLLFHDTSAPRGLWFGGLDRTLLATGLLGLMTGAIVAMKRDSLLRYFAVLLLALALGAISDSFLMLLPALVAWMLTAGWLLVRGADIRSRLRGFAILACGEAGAIVFGTACLLAEPTRTPPPATLFGEVVSFLDFPVLVLAIVTLALGWRGHDSGGKRGKTPPYFLGLMALLVGLLTLLLNDFQAGALPPPGTDQTVLLLCLLYTVCALHAPRPIQRWAPPALLLAAIAYSVWR